MKPGFFYVAERREPSVAFQSIIAALKDIGASLEYPGTGRITHLAYDGDQLETTEADLIVLATLPELVPQFWLEPGVDLACNFRRVDVYTVRHSYSVDGLDKNQREQLEAWSMSYFRRAAEAGTAVLLVVDPTGETEDIDWDAVAVEAAPVPRTMPKVLGLAVERLSGLSLDMRVRQELLGELALLTRP